MPLHFRAATLADIPAIIEMLADDFLGALREDYRTAGFARYEAAFARIDADPNQFLCVVEEEDGTLVGTLQLSFLAGLIQNGATRGQIEAVRVASDRRGRGIGEAMIRWAIEECRAQGCSIVQLTTDRRRTEAHRFYDRLGFAASHLGYKLAL
ncbi:GNAT family N-acetyltransferase [Novosphingopyxis iocasae]|uniref:GNAT family N-acetyltransferase n=1 Tax=Novosphingopyxis iocasae TaxID=2762729 RepID=UPI001651723C|nr:GNAT family N-acetyltransferase [Novosphingopyxis iocasae]